MDTYGIIRYTHITVVILFILIYLIKTILLLSNKEEGLARFTKGVKVPEMIISTLFLLTGIYMLTQIPKINTFMIIKIIVVLASIPIAVVGFKKKNKVLAVLSFIMIAGAYRLAEMSVKQGAAPSPQEGTAAPASSTAVNGHDIFTANCTSCHGDDGKLGLMSSPDLSASALDLNAKIAVIKNGRNAMAGFEGRLSDEQIKAVAEYTETLKK